MVILLPVLAHIVPHRLPVKIVLVVYTVQEHGPVFLPEHTLRTPDRKVPGIIPGQSGIQHQIDGLAVGALDHRIDHITLGKGEIGDIVFLALLPL